jgi:hypothetical protein
VLFIGAAHDGSRVVRNFFSYMTDPYVNGAAEVLSNTFANLGGSVGAVRKNGALTFRNNIVVNAYVGVAIPVSGDTGPLDAAYNLFDGVNFPYLPGTLAPTDVIGPALLQSDGTPAANSAAIDAADPALPVPPDGGARADIGAIERGATKIDDGRYCLPGMN